MCIKRARFNSHATVTRTILSCHFSAEQLLWDDWIWINCRQRLTEHSHAKMETPVYLKFPGCKIHLWVIVVVFFPNYSLQTFNLFKPWANFTFPFVGLQPYTQLWIVGGSDLSGVGCRNVGKLPSCISLSAVKSTVGWTDGRKATAVLYYILTNSLFACYRCFQNLLWQVFL